MITNLSVLADRADLSQMSYEGGRAVAWMSGITGVLIGLVFLAIAVLVIVAIVSTLINSDTSGGGKLLWIIFILWFPLFGAVAWFVVGKKGHLNRFLGIDKGRARHTVPGSVGQHSNIPPDQTGLGNA
ncbi:MULTISPECIES: PLD nuclease N-terminal domain-containing protein [unclassified Nocardiopsis]|uniref:PLD nuclease N-terminal domain-containing protein n=1 Tax=unclassified Nocardiopsis TaxID=2649073 RepID=UPI0033CA0611